MSQEYIDRITDKEALKQKKRIKKLHDKWVPTCGFSWWDITYEYVNRIVDTANPSDFWTSATMRTDWTRMRGTMTIDLRTISTLSDDQLEETFLHELMHMVVKELAACADMSTQDKIDDAEAHEERVVQSLARHFMYAVKNVER